MPNTKPATENQIASLSRLHTAQTPTKRGMAANGHCGKWRTSIENQEFSATNVSRKVATEATGSDASAHRLTQTRPSFSFATAWATVPAKPCWRSRSYWPELIPNPRRGRSRFATVLTSLAFVLLAPTKPALVNCENSLYNEV